MRLSISCFWGVCGALSVTFVAAFLPSGTVVAQERDFEAEVREAESRITSHRGELQANVERLATAGSELQEIQSTLDAASERVLELEGRLEQSRAQLELRQKEREAAEEDYRKGAVRAYQGEGVRDLELVLGGLLGSGDLLDPGLRQSLFGDREDLASRRKAEEAVRQTVEVISAAESSYNVALEDQSAQLRRLEAERRELEEARLALRESIAGEQADIFRIREEERRVRERIARMERRQLREAARQAGRPGGGQEAAQRPAEATGATVSAPVNAPTEELFVFPAGTSASGGSATGRERELEIAEQEIAAGDPALVERLPEAEYMRLYREAAAQYGFANDWYILAAIGEIESGHGENLGPSSAGALGPMQFLPSTWVGYGVDGNGDGEANILDPEDAIPAAAGYLKASGAPEDWYSALYAYNHADWYVQKVLALSEGYRELDREGLL